MGESKVVLDRQEVESYLEKGINPHKDVFKKWTDDQKGYYRSVQFGEDVYQNENAPDFMFFDKDDWRRGEDGVVRPKDVSNG